MIKAMLVATAAGSAIVLGSNATAHADVTSYLTDMEDAGFFNHDGNAAEISVGKGICADLIQGGSVTWEIDDMWKQSHLEHARAAEFVGIAVRDLCPQFTNYLG